MSQYHTVIFDLDGTLADTVGDLNAAVNAALTMHGMPTHTIDETRAAVGNGIRNLIVRSAPEGTDEATCDALLADFRAYYRAHLLVNTVAYPGMVELLKNLKAAGIRLAVASNKFQAGTKEIFDGLFYGLAEEVHGETENCPRKPDPQIVRNILTNLGVTTEGTLLVGDSEVDVQTAKNAGVDFLAVPWGFRTRKELETAGAENFAETAEAIRLFVLGA